MLWKRQSKKQIGENWYWRILRQTRPRRNVVLQVLQAWQHYVFEEAWIIAWHSLPATGLDDLHNIYIRVNIYFPEYILYFEVLYAFFSLIPFISVALLFSIPPSRTQILGNIEGSSPAYPLRFVPSIFVATRFQLFLPSSTRVELCVPTLVCIPNTLVG